MECKKKRNRKHRSRISNPADSNHSSACLSIIAETQEAGLEQMCPAARKEGTVCSSAAYLGTHGTYCCTAAVSSPIQVAPTAANVVFPQLQPRSTTLEVQKIRKQRQSVG